MPSLVDCYSTVRMSGMIRYPALPECRILPFPQNRVGRGCPALPVPATEVAQAAACPAELTVIRPGKSPVTLHAVIELECAHLGQSVLNVVEGEEEDVLLLHPKSALLQKFVAVVVSPGHIGLLDLPPDRPPFHGSHGGMFIDSVLELIHCCHIGDHRQRGGEMGFAVLICFVAKE